MTANPKVTDSLQSTCSLLASCAEQFCSDSIQLAARDIDWLAERFDKWKKKVHGHLVIFEKRLAYYDADPDFEVEPVEGSSGSIDSLLADRQKEVNSYLTQFIDWRKQAYDLQGDYTADLFEHLIRDVEKIAFKIQRERRLISDLTEAGYIAARLEDA